MSDEDQKTEDQTNRSQELRSELQDLRSDVLEVKQTFDTERHNTKGKASHVFGKHKRKIAIAILLVVPAYFVFFKGSFTIPNWFTVMMIGCVVGGFVGYVPAKKLANRFVTDNRVPVLEMNAERWDNNNDNLAENIVAVYAVPQDRITQMEVYEGEAFDMRTKEMGNGYQVEKYEEIEKEGETHVIVKGTWMGEKSSMELAKDVGAIEGMRKTLKPKAQKGFAYELMWPSIMQELQSSIANMITREIQGVTVFKGSGLRTEIDEITDKYSPDNITEKASQEELEENEQIEDMDVSEDSGMVQMLSGDD